MSISISILPTSYGLYPRGLRPYGYAAGPAPPVPGQVLRFGWRSTARRSGPDPAASRAQVVSNSTTQLAQSDIAIAPPGFWPVGFLPPGFLPPRTFE